MKALFALCTLLLFAGSASAQTPAPQDLTQTPGSNVAVTECYPHQHVMGEPGHPWIDPYGALHAAAHFPYSEGFLAITYSNNAAIPATEVDFGLASRGALIAFARDLGTFTPGAAISHEFSVDPKIFPLHKSLPYCVVLRVKYSNGTEWDNPNPRAIY